MRVRTLAPLLALPLLLADRPAEACGGFFVAPKKQEPTAAPMVSDASMVALMREGTRTVVSMSMNYKGPASDFALVVPVPNVLEKENVKTLPRALFTKLDQLTAPRLVEYWERNPCPDEGGSGGLDGLKVGTGGGFGGGAPKGAAPGFAPPAVTVEAEFSVGEYDIVILSATESDALETWLKDHAYNIPTGAAEALAPYIKEQQKFFVAKVDATKTTKDESGVVVLSPLRFEFESKDFRLPLRIGLINNADKQDLIVFVLGTARYEASNYPNVTIPTNLTLTPESAAVFPELYATLFDAAVKKAGGKGLVTEYAWSSNTCDPCPTSALTPQDLATLGARPPVPIGVGAGGDAGVDGGSLGLSGTGPGGGSGEGIGLGTLGSLGHGSGTGLGGIGMGHVPPGTVKIRESGMTVTGKLPPEVVKRIVRANFPRIRACYEAGLKTNPAIAGTVSTKFTIAHDGSVSAVTLEKTTFSDPKVPSCITGIFKALSFPEPESGVVNVSYTVALEKEGQPIAPMVITRLHARYDKTTLNDDVIFRAADPIAGGREIFVQEGPGKKVERGSSKSSSNEFQARYAIRHEWSGALKCDKPERGQWTTALPAGATRVVVGAAKAATGLAAAKRGSVRLSTYVKGGLDDLHDWEEAAPKKPPTPKVDDPDAKPARKACGCSLAPRTEIAPFAALAGLLLLTAARRRTR